MTRIPGADIDAVKEYMRRNGIGSVWTTISFVYPLIFETGEKVVASESIFGVDRPVYPPEIPNRSPAATTALYSLSRLTRPIALRSRALARKREAHPLAAPNKEN